MTPSADPLTRLFRACAPNEALGPDDERYVNCDEVRGEKQLQRIRSVAQRG